MNNIERLKSRFVELYALTRLQTSLRLLLRAFWMGAAGAILAWGANALWGWLPNPASWVLVGLGFALVPIIAIWSALFPVLFSLAPHKQWVWRVDQRLGMREQFSTAWEVVQRKQSGPVSDLLVQEVLAGMPRARQRVLQGGWFRKTDLFASLLVTMIACFLLVAMLLNPTPNITTQPPSAPPAAAPQQAAPPDESQQPEQPGAAAGEGDGEAGEGEPGGDQGEGDSQGSEPAAGDGSGEGQGGEGGEQGAQASQPGADSDALGQALRELGAALSQQAGTYELGQALENLDLERASEALDDLSERLNELSPESRANMAEAMENAAGDSAQAGDQPLAEELNDAAEALSGQEAGAGEAMGDLADALRERAGQMQPAAGASPGAGQGSSPETGSPEPIRRLQNEGGKFDLPLDSAAESHLISPAPPDAQGEGTAGGAYNSTYQQGSDAARIPLLPNSLLWKWRDVVSEYFQR